MEGRGKGEFSNFSIQSSVKTGRGENIRRLRGLCRLFRGFLRGGVRREEIHMDLQDGQGKDLEVLSFELSEIRKR